jgi:hypothetical protein
MLKRAHRFKMSTILQRGSLPPHIRMNTLKRGSDAVAGVFYSIIHNRMVLLMIRAELNPTSIHASGQQERLAAQHLSLPDACAIVPWSA